MINKHTSSSSTFSPDAVAVSFIHLFIYGCFEGAVSSGRNPRWRRPRHGPPGHRPSITSTEWGREHDEPAPIKASLQHSTLHCREVGAQECKKEIEQPICLVCPSPGVWEQPASSAQGCRTRRMGRLQPLGLTRRAPGPASGAGLLWRGALRAGSDGG